MMNDWRAFSKKAKVVVEDHTILVELSEGRSQKVFVEDEGEDGYFRAWSIAVGASSMSATHESPEFFAWRRNHLSDLVGFKIDRKGRLIGEAWIPAEGLDAEEWAIYIKALAQSCDRIEYMLTGKDQL